MNEPTTDLLLECSTSVVPNMTDSNSEVYRVENRQNNSIDQEYCFNSDMLR